MIRRAYRKMYQFWLKEQSFSVLLLVLVLYIFVIFPLTQKSLFGQIVFDIFYYLLLTSGLPFTSHSYKPGIVLVLSIAPLAFMVAGLFFKSEWLGVTIDLFMVFYCILLGRIILHRTFAEGRITIHRVQGAIVVYLLVGFIFALLYDADCRLEGVMAFRGLDRFGRKDFMYFSLTTLTTVGYGDITPVFASARSLANLEALIGQLYPAVLIARLVSMEFISAKNE
jgi:voltage-gated potassium channel Kch